MSAGLHGAQIRVDGEIRSQAEAPEAMREAMRDLVRFANSHVGVIVEDKRISAALHWRLAPQLDDEALDLLRRIAARMGPGVRLQEGKSVAELVPASASKGGAIAWLMQNRPPMPGASPSSSATTSPTKPGSRPSMRWAACRSGSAAGETRATHRIASPTALRAILLGAAESGSLTASSFSQD